MGDLRYYNVRYSYVYGKRFLRGIIRPKQEGIKGGQKHHKLYCSEYQQANALGTYSTHDRVKNEKLCRIIIGETERKRPLKSLQ
jgi:hypothetical protein